VRSQNEDSLQAGPLGEGEVAEPRWYVFAVADGVGGHMRGEWASQTAITTLSAHILASIDRDSPPEALRGAFRAANSAIWDHTPQRAGNRAATTLVAALVNRGILWWANVGDSRAYLVRRGRATRLTTDHSWVEAQVRAGVMTADQARISGRRNVITRSIGFDVDVEVDLGGPIALRSGDGLVLCTDGLYGVVADDELARVVQQLLPEAAAERLVALSNERGGPDNISVIVCTLVDGSLGEPGHATESPTTQATARVH
jgi:protein phosphatase